VPVLLTHLLDAALSGVLAWAFLSAPKLFSAQFIDAVHVPELSGLFDPNLALTQYWLGKMLLGIIVFGLAVGSISTIVRTIRRMSEKAG